MLKMMLTLVVSLVLMGSAVVVGVRTQLSERPDVAVVVQSPTPYHDAEHDTLMRAIAAGDAARPERVKPRVSRDRPSPPKPQPKPIKVIPRNELERLALAAAKKWGIDAGKFFSVIKCESGWDPTASNSCCHGLTAQHEDYWTARSKRAGYGGYSIYHPEANLFTGAMLAAKGGWGHYDCV